MMMFILGLSFLIADHSEGRMSGELFITENQGPSPAAGGLKDLCLKGLKLSKMSPGSPGVGGTKELSKSDMFSRLLNTIYRRHLCKWYISDLKSPRFGGPEVGTNFKETLQRTEMCESVSRKRQQVDCF